MENTKKILGVLLIIVSICGIISWEKWGRNELLYKEAVVLNQSISKGTIIKKSMIKTVKLERKNKDSLSPGEEKKIIGKEAAQFIHKGDVIYKEYFVQEGLNPSSSKDIFEMTVPENWLESYPSGIYRGGKAVFYCEGKFITSAMVAGVNKDEGSVSIMVSGKQMGAFSKLVAGGSRFVISYE